jgi:hypothetical protein
MIFSHSRAYRRIALLKIVLYLAGIVLLGFSYLLFFQRCIAPSTFEGFIDLRSFYAASVAVFRDHLSPYDLDRLTQINRLEFRTFPFLYPPPSIFLFKPLATHSFEEAKQIITIFNHITLVPTLLAIPLFVLKLSPRRDYWRFSLCLLYPLYTFPLILTIRYGQINIALMAALVGFWIAAQRDRSLIAGLCLCAAILCKTIPLLFIPMLLAIGRWKLCACTLISLAIVSGFSYAVLPTNMWDEWLFHIAPSGGYMNAPLALFSPAAVWNQSLNGIIARLLTQSAWSDPGFHAPMLAKVATYACALSVMTISAFLLRRVRHSAHAVSLLSVVTLPMIFLIAPFSWEHHIAYILPAILFILCAQCPWSRWWRITIAVVASVIAATLTTDHLLFYRFTSVSLLWVTAALITWKHGNEIQNKGLR